MKFTRNLKLNMSGEDVLYIKKKLFDLGYFASNIKKVSSKTFRKDTLNAVIFFQGRNKDKYNRDLVTDGIIGELTWEAIERIHAKMLEEDNKDMETPVTNDILDIIDTYTQNIIRFKSGFFHNINPHCLKNLFHKRNLFPQFFRHRLSGTLIFLKHLMTEGRRLYVKSHGKILRLFFFQDFK